VKFRTNRRLDKRRLRVSEGPSPCIKWVLARGSGNSVEPSPSEAPPSPASHPDSDPAKQWDAAPRKSLAQLDRIAFLQIDAFDPRQTRCDCAGRVADAIYLDYC
jgi:hypothetical protein